MVIAFVCIHSFLLFWTKAEIFFLSADGKKQNQTPLIESFASIELDLLCAALCCFFASRLSLEASIPCVFTHESRAISRSVFLSTGTEAKESSMHSNIWQACQAIMVFVSKRWVLQAGITVGLLDVWFGCIYLSESSGVGYQFPADFVLSEYLLLLEHNKNTEAQP
ncbi:hypothetical protein [Algicola sagamiensis]|uniref:hypothetical protein n=1 Tax=Algicola sagamiensis TaxID=163869 RepID=UPI0012FC4D27|nr:hypothetical protein [Algicola sagamiensis]